MVESAEDLEWPWDEDNTRPAEGSAPKVSAPDVSSAGVDSPDVSSPDVPSPKRPVPPSASEVAHARMAKAKAKRAAGAAKDGAAKGSDAPSEGQKDWVLARKYKIRKLLGRTEHGRLYRAMQQPLDRPVFIHIIPIRYRSAEEVQALRRHIHRAADVRHRNVAAVQDVDVTRGGMMYVVYEDRSQNTLRDQLAEGKPLTIFDTVLVGLQIARGMRAAHEENVTHFALCPENILLASLEDTDVPTAMVFGFGLSPAQLASDARRSNDGQAYLPTLHNYLAPEQIAGDTTNFRTDVYGVGVLLYEMLAGRPPFEGDNAVNTLYAKIQGDIPSLKDMPHLRFLPIEFESLVLKCLHRSADERFATMDDVVNGLKAIIPRVEVAQRLADASGPNAAAVDALLKATVPPQQAAPPLSVADAISDALGTPKTPPALPASAPLTPPLPVEEDDDLELLDDSDVLEASDSRPAAPGPIPVDEPFPVRGKRPPPMPPSTPPSTLTAPAGPTLNFTAFAEEAPPARVEPPRRVLWPYVVAASLFAVFLLWFFALKNPAVPPQMTAPSAPFERAPTPQKRLVRVQTQPAGLTLSDENGRVFGKTPVDVTLTRALTLYAKTEDGRTSAPLNIVPTMEEASFDLRLAFGLPIDDETPKAIPPPKADPTPVALPFHEGLPPEPLPAAKKATRPPSPPKATSAARKDDNDDFPTGADWLETDDPAPAPPKKVVPREKRDPPNPNATGAVDPPPKPKTTTPPPATAPVDPPKAKPEKRQKRRPSIDMLDD